MMWLYGIMALILALPILGIGPIEKRGGNVAQNRLAYIKLPYDHVTQTQGQSPRGRRAHEVVEYYLRLIPPAIAATVASLLIPDKVVAAAAFFCVASIGMLWTEVFEFDFDLVGHKAEIMVAEYDGRAGYEAEEIARMRRDPKFMKLSATELRQQLDRKRWLARILLTVLRANVGPA